MEKQLDKHCSFSCCPQFCMCIGVPSARMRKKLFFGTWIAYSYHLNTCLCLLCLTSFQTSADNLRSYVVVWICSSFSFRADCQKQTLSRELSYAWDSGLWGFCLSTPLKLKLVQSDLGGFSHLSQMYVAAAVPVGRSGQQQDLTCIPETQLARCMHA